ncbi:MAG: hypothetical protein ABFS43_17560 [Thermodesulfobacteriota bacterium]
MADIYSFKAPPESYKWLILALSTFTFTFVVAIPQMSLPVLFAEISDDLGLSLVQVLFLASLVMVSLACYLFIQRPGDRSA